MSKSDTYNYPKEIETFIDYLNRQLDHAWEEESKGSNEAMDALYNEKFEITFRGITLELYFGACEFNALIECLETIKEENI